MLNRFKDIRCFVFDVDGVLTDGSILVTEQGEQWRTMNIKDGYALQLAVKKGYEVVVISGAQGKGVPDRLQKLGIDSVFMGVKDKVAVFEHWRAEKKLDRSAILVMGDDVPDLELMRIAGIAAAPADASADIKMMAEYMSPFGGGRGCVRDVIEKVLRLRGDWLHQSEVTAQ